MKTKQTKQKKRRNVILEKVCSTVQDVLVVYPQREIKVEKVSIQRKEVFYNTPKHILDSVELKRSMTEKLNIELAAFRNRRMQEIKEFALLFDYKLNLSTINEGEF